MHFTQPSFYLFFAAVVLLFALCRNTRQKQVLLLVASLLFYANFSLVFCALLIATILLDFFIGLQLHKNKTKLWLLVSLVVNFLPLVVYRLSSFVGVSLLDQLVVPLGLSFYTFKSASYILDVHRGTQEPSTDIIQYGLFVSYFPALLSGPVSRFEHFESGSKDLKLDSASWRKGCYLVVQGLAKKILIADTLHKLLLPVWDLRSQGSLSSGLAFAIVLATYIKLYCDFSGYTDIARGVSYFFNLRLPENFHFPFFAKTPSEFWSRQHISMSRWFQDYVYMQIIRKLKRNPDLAVLAGLWMTFFLSAIWHGISEGTFIFFILQALLNSGFYFYSRSRARGRGRFATVLSWLITQTVCMTSIFCLLTPKMEDIEWVLASLVGDGAVVAYLSSGFVLFLISFLIIHLIQYLIQDKPQWQILRSKLMPVVAALVLVSVLLLKGDTVQFIYYRF